MDTNPPEQPHPEIEMPAPSFWPIVLAFGLLLIAVGVLFTLIVSLIGVIIMLAALIGWTLENRVDEGAEDVDETEESPFGGGQSHGAAVYDTKVDAAGPAQGGKGKYE
jgi:hypothetical protein